MGHVHGLHAVADQFPAGQGIFHADMAHGNAVTDADGRHQDGSAAGHAHTGLDRIGQFVQVHVAGYDLTVGGHHADERAVQFLGRVAQGIEQAAVGRAFRAFFDIIAVHGDHSVFCVIHKTGRAASAPWSRPDRGQVFTS